MIKKLIPFFLIIVILLVWFFIFQNIRTITSSVHYNKDEYKSVASETLPKFKFVYKDLARDPFILQKEKESVSEPKLDISLQGIVISKGERLALIKMSNDVVYPLRQGERFKGIKVEKITRGAVVINVEGRRELLKLQE
ncbi:hypothetical protein BXT86_01280 [candidate division WOR-3 bacterium 4484_100]|uniref:Type II secretion system protein GspC N-terminal domain-containing protein n=1 Tax=candidate division WOR-3 bacterium 4484_100 TaxID=1936077 RepID=A0A1V4QHD3_UNCW3|nr:MAG: hypothetical protein BXT86_01280 [candidate division WOR-3 bacterium 4484_100]